MGDCNRVVVGIGGVTQEHGFAADIMQQDARGNHNEIGFAEGQAAFIIEQGKAQAGRGLGHGDDRAHAFAYRDGVRLVFLHKVAEYFCQQECFLREGVHLLQGVRRPRTGDQLCRGNLLLPGQECDTGLPQVFTGQVFALPHEGFISAGGLYPRGQFLIGDLGIFQAPQFPGAFRRTAHASLVPADGGADGDHAFAPDIFQSVQRPQTP
ncbi:MAG: hypothetical protein BWX80_03335 [Candidatus Hydrogenedentes bacterium ADurb.Bin101]|nr:MAG: hypothetical protein BWX80_03335 [Candidatus Hydrogenedentes bacterium ADurb.Bin101]